MKNNSVTNIERIIAKIDNDFNPDGTDWIPRVGAWTYDAMSMLGAIQYETKTKVLNVVNRIAKIPTCADIKDLKVYDEKGCRVRELEDMCDCVSLRGDSSEEFIDATLSIAVNKNPEVNIHADHAIIAGQDENKEPIVEVHHYNNADNTLNYVVTKNGMIEFNKDIKTVTVKYSDIKSSCDNKWGCDLPVIPNNGLLIEAIAYYCMYKMLCRGYTHPVFNLKASQYGTNPYYEWQQLKDKAKRSVIIDAQGNVEDDSHLWNSAFYLYTFVPKL